MLFRGDLFAPTDISPNLENPSFPMLGMRVVNVTAVAIPFGLKGTVVGIHANTGYVDILFDEDFGSGRPIIGAASKFRGALVPWSSVLCITSDDAIRNFARQIRSGSHAAFGVPESVLKGGAIRSQSSASKGGKPAGTPKAAEVKNGVVGAKAPQISAPVVVSKAPETMGSFRIIKRVESGTPIATAAAAATTEVPTAALKQGKKPKVPRKSDGTGLMALAAAATGQDVLSASSSERSAEPIVAPDASGNAGKALLSMLKSASSTGNTSTVSASSLKSGGSSAVLVSSASSAPESGNAAGQKLLSFIKNSDASSASADGTPPLPAPAPEGIATTSASTAVTSSPSPAAGSSSKKLVPASLLVRKSSK
jgi:hypothetical protein